MASALNVKRYGWQCVFFKLVVSRPGRQVVRPRLSQLLSLGEDSQPSKASWSGVPALLAISSRARRWIELW